MRLSPAFRAFICTVVLASTGLAAQQDFDPSVARPITAEALKKKLDAGEKVMIVDGRSELDGEIVKGAVQVPYEKLVGWSDSAPKDTTLVFYCTCPDDEIAIDDVTGLQNLGGFTNAYYLKGGLEAARKAGIPIVKPAA